MVFWPPRVTSWIHFTSLVCKNVKKKKKNKSDVEFQIIDLKTTSGNDALPVPPLHSVYYRLQILIHSILAGMAGHCKFE